MEKRRAINQKGSNREIHPVRKKEEKKENLFTIEKNENKVSVDKNRDTLNKLRKSTNKKCISTKLRFWTCADYTTWLGR